MPTTEIHALAGAYALDALNDIERTAFGRHLAECEACAFEVAELRETTARLADATWSVPPPRLRDQVMAQARRTRQLGPGRGDRDVGAAPVRWRRWTAAAVAAGILAVGGGAATYAIQEGRVRQERAAAAAARDRAARIEAVLAAPDARLRSATPATGGRVTVVVSDSLDAGVAVLAGLPSPGRDRAYQLWTIGDRGPVGAGLLPAGASDATTPVTGVRSAAQFAVSVEPAGGSDQPTTSAIMLSMALT